MIKTVDAADETTS